MPVNGNKVTMIFQNGQYGFSESHIYLGNASLDATFPDANTMLKARYKMMGALVQAVAVRISKEGVFRDSKIFDAEDLAIPQKGLNEDKLAGGGEQKNTPDQSKACGLLRMEAGNTNRRSLYLAGIPDALIEGAPPVFNIYNIPGWDKIYKAWKNLMIGGKWGFVIRDQSVFNTTKLPIVAFSQQNVTGLLGVTVAGTVSVVAPYNRLVIKGCRVSNRAYRNPNGSWQIAQTEAGPNAGQTTYWLLNSRGVLASTVTANGFLGALDFTAVPYTDVIVRVPTTRKRGNRSLVGPGRRSTRQYLSV